ncbi:MAG: site-2 protease family protein [Candidatus Lokiarchaeia archaeon]
MRRIVERHFIVFEAYLELDGSPTFILPSSQDTKIPFQRLIEDLSKYDLIPLLRKAERVPQRNQLYPDYSILEKEEPELVLKIFPSPEPKKTRSPIINVLLLAATILTISYTGYLQVQDYNYFGMMINFLAGPQWAWYGDPGLLIIAFTASLLAIIGLHEMGHYVTARIRKQKASLPFFIPGYPPLGTLGAVIVQRTPTVNRDRLFELGLMGPLTGFIITIIILIISIHATPIIYPNVMVEIYKANFQFNQQMISMYGYDFFGFLLNLGLPLLWVGPSPFTDPLLYDLLGPLIRTTPLFSFMPIHPLSWAAWLGMLVTGINLFPIGVLDAGHMARSFLSQRQHIIASLIAAGAMILFSTGYLFFVILVFLLSPRRGHPGALDDVSPVEKKKIAIFAVMMIIAILTIPRIPGLF